MKFIQRHKAALTEMGYYCGSPKNNGEFKLLNKISKNFQVFIDVGFYKGLITKNILKRNKKIKVYGFDLNFKSKIIKKNLILINCGLHKFNTKKIAYIYKKRPELSSLAVRRDYNPSIQKNYSKKKLKLISLDFFLKKNELMSKKILIKIDAEGSERDIIFGLKKSIKRSNLSGYFEYSSGWKNFNATLKEVFHFLKESKYNVFRLTKNGLIEMRYFTYMDEIYSQSHFFFTKEDLTKLGFKKKKIFSLTSDKKENIYKY